MIRIKVDNKELLVEKGANLLEVAKKEGIYIPALCYLRDKIPPIHSCGLCVVKIEGEGIVRSCEYRIEKEIFVETTTPELKEIRRKILENLIANHYGDCKAPCHTPCPGGLNIQGYIGFIAKGDFKAALALIKEKLPLPASVGRVCPRFCEPVCRRALVDQAVAINNLKRFVADYCYEFGELPIDLPELNGIKVAIVGAGPAGLSCAYFLRLKGYEVTIFDKEEEPGGLLRYGIPTYKLPKEVLRRETENIFKMGIKFQGRKVWGKDFTLKDLKKEGFKAIFLAVGARKEKFFGFRGEELAESGLEFLYRFNKGEEKPSYYQNYQKKRCAILGCSYTAVELARVLRRLGAEVSVYYPRSRMEVPVPLREIGYAEREGVKFVYVTAPWDLTKSNEKYRLILVRTSLTEKREIKFLFDTAFEETFDFVFRAWGEIPSEEFIKYGELEAKLEITPEGNIKVDSQTLQTNLEGIFAGGDFIYGSRTVIQAVASGRKAAQSISAFLEGKAIDKAPFSIKYDFTRGKRAEEFDSNFLDLFAPEERAKLKERDPELRIKDFEEVLIGLTPEEAVKEANRCLRCGCLGIHKCEFREIIIKEDINVTKARKRMKYPIQKEHLLIEVDLNKCIACERCVRICPYSAIFFKVVNKGKSTEYITFRFTEACINCGVCVDVCPTGALIKKDLLVPYNRKKAKAVKSVCSYCGTGCNITIWVKNGTILEITGRDLPPNYGFLCVKGMFGFEYYKSPDRLTKPLLRESTSEEFKEVSWDFALKFVAERFLNIKNKYGPQALGFLCSSKVSNEENYLMQKIARSIFKTNNIDNSARVCHAPSAMGLAATVGIGAACVNFDEILRAELLFLIGTNSFETHPIVSQKVIQALNNGAKCIVADPRRIYFADKANIFLPLRPGSNVPLLNGMAYVIIRDKLYNEEFIEKYVKNFEAYKHYILNEWNLAKASIYTGLKPFLIEEAAYLYAGAKSALILWGLGVSQHRSGTYAAMAAANLATLCGFWGKPGCGAMPLRGQNNVQGACDIGGLPHVLPGYQNYLDESVRLKFQEVWGTDLPTQEGKTLSTMLRDALSGKLKALYAMGYDIARSHGDLGQVWKALSNLEFLVVQDIFMPFSAKYAHVILPAACHFEKCGTFTNTERRVQLFEKAVVPPGEALPDWLILTKLAETLGVKWNYNSPEEILKEIGKVWQAWRGLSYERLSKIGIQWPCFDENHPGTPILFTSGFPKGKVHLAIVKYVPPFEEPTPEFPFILVTARKLEHYNVGSMTKRSKALTRVYSHPIIELNPEDAKRLKFLEGALVKVWNKRGEVFFRVKLNSRVPQGLLFTNFHFESALTNLLISPGLDELMETPEYKVSAVNIKLAE